MSANLEYRAREIQRKRESGWQASKARREKERQRVSARDKKQRTHFLVEEQHENFVAMVRKWEMLAVTKVKMSSSEKKENKNMYDIFSIKHVTRKFLEVSRCSLTKQWHKIKKVCCASKVAFLLITLHL